MHAPTHTTHPNLHHLDMRARAHTERRRTYPPHSSLKTVQQSGGAATLLLLLPSMDDVNLVGMICKRYGLSVKQYG